MNEQKIGRSKEATNTMICPDCGRQLWIIWGGGGGAYLVCECGGKLMRPYIGNLREWLHDLRKRVIVRQLPPETAND